MYLRFYVKKDRGRGLITPIFFVLSIELRHRVSTYSTHNAPPEGPLIPTHMLSRSATRRWISYGDGSVQKIRKAAARLSDSDSARGTQHSSLKNQKLLKLFDLWFVPEDLFFFLNAHSPMVLLVDQHPLIQRIVCGSERNENRHQAE